MLVKHVITVKNTHTSYTMIGDADSKKDTIVFLHGRMSEGNHFIVCAQMLAQQGYTIMLVDIPGFGQSAEPDAAWTIQNYAQWLDELLISFAAESNKDSFVLVSHSFGGRVSIEALADIHSYAVTHVRKLILLASGGLNTPTNSGTAKTVSAINSSLNRFGGAGRAVKSLLHKVAKPFYSSDYRHVSPMMQQVFKQTVIYNQHHLLSRIETPALIIRGDKDDQAPVSDAQYFYEHMKHAQVEIIPGAGHFSFVDYPQDIVAHISGFLNDARG